MLNSPSFSAARVLASETLDDEVRLMINDDIRCAVAEADDALKGAGLPTYSDMARMLKQHKAIHEQLKVMRKTPSRQRTRQEQDDLCRAEKTKYVLRYHIDALIRELPQL